MKILEYIGLDTSGVEASYRKVADAIARHDFRSAQVKKLVNSRPRQVLPSEARYRRPAAVHLDSYNAILPRLVSGPAREESNSSQTVTSSRNHRGLARLGCITGRASSLRRLGTGTFWLNGRRCTAVGRTSSTIGKMRSGISTTKSHEDHNSRVGEPRSDRGLQFLRAAGRRRRQLFPYSLQQWLSELLAELLQTDAVGHPRRMSPNRVESFRSKAIACWSPARLGENLQCLAGR